MMQKKEHLYSGKAKSLFKTDDPNFVVMLFRDDTSAFDGQKVEKLPRKGLVNNQFNAFIMQHIADAGVGTHFVRLLTSVESLVKSLEMIPIECVVRNYAAGGLSRRLGVAEGLKLDPPTLEFFLKNDELHDPMINEYHIETFKWATAHEVETLKKLSFKVNEILVPLFAKAGLLLVDFKLEFGRLDGHLVLGDEFTPDGCRIWDQNSREKLDKDRFRRDLGQVIESYETVAERLGIEIHEKI